MHILDGYVSPKLMINLENFSCKVYKVKRTLSSALICLVVMIIAKNILFVLGQFMLNHKEQIWCIGRQPIHSSVHEHWINVTPP